MGRYLDKFVSTMPANQARYVVQFLNEMKDSGLIRTTEEYNTQLQALTAQLKSDESQPLFKLFMAQVNELIDADKFNAMVKHAKADLQVAFIEADNIATVLELHKNLYKLTVLNGLKRAVDSIGNKISLYEFLRNNTDGFSSGQFNTFDDTDSLTDRTSTIAKQLYLDRTTGSLMQEFYDSDIDINGQRLILPSYDNTEIVPTQVETVLFLLIGSILWCLLHRIVLASK
jgi:hypothetical protein